MAAFLVIQDPDPQRRKGSVDAARKLLRAVEGIEVGSVEVGPSSLIWGAPPGAAAEIDSQSEACYILLGEALAEASGQRVGARAYWPPLQIAKPGGGPGETSGSQAFDASHHTSGDTQPPVYDGFHLAIRARGNGAVSVSVDSLGIFPVYVSKTGDALLIASSVRLLRVHPSFEPRLDPLGLVGVLMTNGLVDGRTAFDGVRRLSPGHHLEVSAEGEVREVENFRFPFSDEFHDVPEEECAQLLHEALLEACTKHLPAEPHSLMLSGGMDSRILAGLMVKQGVPTTALTMGIPRDLDHWCASRVARRLSLPQITLPDHEPAIPEFEEGLWWNGFTRSPSSAGYLAMGSRLRNHAPWVVSGYLMDAVVGGSHILWCYSPGERSIGFGPFFERINQWGIRIDTLRHLLRPGPFKGVVEEVRERVHRAYTDGARGSLARALIFDLANRQRFWIGDMIARQAFGAWPRLPHLDTSVLKVAGGVPLSHLAGRSLEKKVLKRNYPDLADLPLDRTRLGTRPVRVSTRGLLAEAVRQRWRHMAQALHLPWRNTVYYLRTFDFNGSHWQPIRDAMEPYRPLARDYFDPETFDAILPPARARWSGYPLAEASGPKMLLGLLALLRSGAGFGHG